MALRLGTSFTGIAGERLQVGEPIRAADLATLADDQAFVFEKITGTSAADGTSASTVTKHTHAEEGNLIFRQLACQIFEVNASAYAQDFATFRIVTTTSTTPATYRPMAGLVFVPRGFENRPIAVIFDCQGNPRFKLSVYDDTMAVVTDQENLPLLNGYGSGLIESMVVDANLDAQATFATTFEVPAAGVYVLDFETDVQAVPEERVVRSFMVIGAYDPMMRGSVPEPPESTGTNVTVGDPDNSNAWHPVDDKLVTANEGLHSATTVILTHNNNRNFEQLTGNPAPGNAAMTLSRGHNHDGDGQDGEEIEFTLWNATLGGDAQANTYGFRAKGPTADDTTGGVVAAGYAYAPNTVNSAAANSKVKFAALVWCESGKGSTMQVIATFGSTTKTFQTTGAAAGIHVLKTPTAGANQFGYTNNANNLLGLSIKQSVVGTSVCRLYAGLFYLDV